MAERTQCDRADKATGHRWEIEHRGRGARIAAALPELARAVHTKDQLSHDADRREHSRDERCIWPYCDPDERSRDGNQSDETALYGMTEFRQAFRPRPHPLRRIQQDEHAPDR